MRKGYLLDLSASGLLSLAIDRAKENRRRATVTWSYGIMTVPSRAHDLLPQTIASLKSAGFDDPLLCVDGATDLSAYERFGLQVTAHSVARGNFANWYLTALEVVLKNPHASMYAVFEDDIVMSMGAREYLTRTCVEPKGYYNLYSSPHNERRVKPDFQGWFMSDQQGHGALALVFSGETLRKLIQEPAMMRWQLNPERGHKFVDGAVQQALSRHGVLEWCHQPSIVEHMGDVSTLQPQEYADTYGKTRSFRGEQFDLRSLPR